MRRHSPRGDQRGFTLLEVVIVMSIGALLVAITMNTFPGMQARLGVRSAQTNFLSLHAQTRAVAVERGRAVQLIADPETHTVSIRVGCAGNGELLESRDFQESYGTTIGTGGAGTVSLCMTPRGYADPNGNSFALQARISFQRGGETSVVGLLPLGQAVIP
jgi:prepilin-type N-terminal cleavage/methylation domain-containing protein